MSDNPYATPSADNRVQSDKARDAHPPRTGPWLVPITVLLFLAFMLAIPGVVLTVGGVGSALSVASSVGLGNLLDLGLFRDALFAVMVGTCFVGMSLCLTIASWGIRHSRWRYVFAMIACTFAAALLAALFISIAH